ncbi:hypothetical protein HP532_30360, partial [Pseudomonas sp. CrR25]|nr:hypothetical protein [Pseudomonas sp. CrR25]
TPLEGSNTVAVRQTDAAGNVSGSSSLSFVLDTQVAAPGLALSHDSGTAGDLLSNDGSLSISGIESGALVEYSIDGGSTWSSSFTPLEGSNTVAVRQTDAAGNVSGSSSLSFVLDTQVAAPGLALSHDSGTAGDLLSNDGSLSISGIESGALVEYSIDGGNTWSSSFTPLEGSNTVAVRQTDAAGNVSGSSSLSFVLDTQVAAPGLALSHDSGTAGDLLSNDGSLSISGIESG